MYCVVAGATWLGNSVVRFLWLAGFDVGGRQNVCKKEAESSCQPHYYLGKSKAKTNSSTRRFVQGLRFLKYRFHYRRAWVPHVERKHKYKKKAKENCDEESSAKSRCKCRTHI